MVEAEAHDPHVLPHIYDQEILVEMFPQIDLSVERANYHDWITGHCFWERESGDPFVDVRRRNRTVRPERRRSSKSVCNSC